MQRLLILFVVCLSMQVLHPLTSSMLISHQHRLQQLLQRNQTSLSLMLTRVHHKLVSLVLQRSELYVHLEVLE
ncbi:Uncharacterised protein [Streptococcus pneumoniae]|nr:Uncharacterised protein [Streptococcus pneumoniae]